MLAHGARAVHVVVVCGAAGFALRKASFFLSLLTFVPLFAVVSYMIGAMPEPIARPLLRLLTRIGVDIAGSQGASAHASDLRDVPDTAPQSASTP